MADPTLSRPSPGEPEQGPGHFSIIAYTICFAVLVCLTLLSFLVSYVNLGWFGTVVALAIATMKVTLVGLYFMHLLKEPPSHRLAAIAAALFVAILASLAATDVWTRYT
jgi:cytochrome c oxidase subunit 4